MVRILESEVSAGLAHCTQNTRESLKLLSASVLPTSAREMKSFLRAGLERNMMLEIIRAALLWLLIAFPAAMITNILESSLPSSSDHAWACSSCSKHIFLQFLNLCISSNFKTLFIAFLEDPLYSFHGRKRFQPYCISSLHARFIVILLKHKQIPYSPNY